MRPLLAATTLAATALLLALVEGAFGAADLPEPFTRFTSNVRVARQGDMIALTTDDLPNHPSPYFPLASGRYAPYDGTNPRFRRNPSWIIPQRLTLHIPARPREAHNKWPTRLGPIGLALNGVTLFNQYAAGYMPLGPEIDSFDQFNGHPQAAGQYHYHVEPLYLTGTLGKDALLGFLLDGFPVYGPREGGLTVTNAQLDPYHGHAHATRDYPRGTYHYHITAEDPYLNGGQYFGSPGWITF